RTIEACCGDSSVRLWKALASSMISASEYSAASRTRIVIFGLTALRAAPIVWYRPPALASFDTVSRFSTTASQVHCQFQGSTPSGATAPTYSGRSPPAPPVAGPEPEPGSRGGLSKVSLDQGNHWSSFGSSSPGCCTYRQL